MKIFIFFLVIIIAIIVSYLFIKRASDKLAELNKGNQKNILTPRNTKRRFKMMTYQEALEASKQFIYNITKAVMQRFTPDAQQQLLDLGRKLVKNGVTYLHVVDVAALSAEKEKQLTNMQKKEVSTTRKL